jgi:hypothetical protein
MHLDAVEAFCKASNLGETVFCQPMPIAVEGVEGHLSGNPLANGPTPKGQRVGTPTPHYMIGLLTGNERSVEAFEMVKAVKRCVRAYGKSIGQLE